jgi:hypothetical protein
MPPLSLKITGGGVVVPLSAWVLAGGRELCFFDYYLFPGSQLFYNRIGIPR